MALVPQRGIACNSGFCLGSVLEIGGTTLSHKLRHRYIIGVHPHPRSVCYSYWEVTSIPQSRLPAAFYSFPNSRHEVMGAHFDLFLVSLP
jgi:hypothetical protein